MDSKADERDSDKDVNELVTVKEEVQEDTIKTYAESTMNELLGLFGYDDKVNSSDTQNLHLENYTDAKDDGSDVISDDDTNDEQPKKSIKIKSKLRRRLKTSETNSLALQHMNLVSALKHRETAASKGSDDTEDKEVPECNWCRKPANKQFSLEAATGSKVFCGEVCFTQCRRASFKKSKVCDWCKHVRHTVNYVEFQDGETQLQFCSDKCLNQYKMSIFCKETQEHIQKLNDNSDDANNDKENEKEILITPELWLSGEQARRAAEAKRSARERARLEQSHGRENFRKTYSGTQEKHRAKTDTQENGARISLIDKIKQEANTTNRLRTPSRQTDKISPTRSSETRNQSPNQTQTMPPLPAHLLHPALSGMGPWLHQLQLMGSLGPGMPPFGTFPPLMFPGGYLPALPGGVAPDMRRPAQDQEQKDRDRSTDHTDPPLTNGYLLSPHSEPSTSSETSSQKDMTHPPRSATSPVSMGRRTSSLFPVDFPQMFPGHQFPGAQYPHLPTGAETNQSSGQPALSDIPPVTMMMPFPVMVPFPVPVPIPIPLTMDTLKKHFGHKTTEASVSPRETKSSLKLPEKLKDTRSPRTLQMHSPQSVCSSVSDFTRYEPAEVRAGSRNSCPDFSQSYSKIELTRHSISDKTSCKRSRTPDTSYKRSRTPDDAKSLDLSKSAKYPKYESINFNSNSNDGVIDLSASRTNAFRSDDTDSENGFTNGISEEDDRSVSRDSNENVDNGPPVPKIHIITHQDESPLNQPLPLPPTENPYSTRRGLILDAPTIPKKSRSPSPERRIYVRNVPRDIIEAARRRCMRSRIRTK